MAEKEKTEQAPGSKIPEEVREHYRNARQAWRQGIEAMMPPEVRQHHRQARKEMLLAWRSMIDYAIEKMEEKKN